MTQDLCRAEFEKWFTDYYYYSPYSLNKDEFYSTLSQTRWIAWQAGWNAKQLTEATENVSCTNLTNAADNSQNTEWE